MAGFVLMHRDILGWEWYESPTVSRLYFHLIFKVNYTDKKWQGLLVKRGQLITSNNHLAIELKLSIQMIRTALHKLQDSGYIKIESTNRFTLITLVNYDKFQSAKTEGNKPANIQSTFKKQSSNSQLTTTKQSNKEKKSNKKTIEERRLKFKNEVFAHSQFEIKILKYFFNYWSESDQEKKLMRCENQDFFETDKRLEKWLKNEKPNYSKNVTSGTASNR